MLPAKISRFTARTWKVHIEGITPILFNNESAMVLNPKKERSMSYEEFEEKYWLNKAHLSHEGNVLLPSTWFKKAMIVSQAKSAVPIQPKTSRSKMETLKNYLTASVFIEDSLVTIDGKVLTKEGLIKFAKGVNRGTPSQPKKVITIRPSCPHNWKATVTFTDTEGGLTLENIYEIFAWIGSRNGLGDWRVSRGGTFGMFKVVDIEE